MNNTIVKDFKDKEIFIFMTIDNIDFEITISLLFCNFNLFNKPTINNYNIMDDQGYKA